MNLEEVAKNNGYAYRPHNHWGGTVKEEIQADMVLKWIADKCKQHKHKCYYCPFFYHEYDECFFKHDFEDGEDVHFQWRNRY